MDNLFRNLTVIGLKNLARSRGLRGLRGYSRLRRAELIELLINTGFPVLDIDMENTEAPVLQPTTTLPSPPTPTPVTPPTQQTVEDLLRSLERVREVPKNISPELNALKKKIKNYIVKKIKLELSKVNQL